MGFTYCGAWNAAKENQLGEGGEGDRFQRSGKMKRNGSIIAISLILAMSFSCSAIALAGPEDARGRKVVVVQSDKPVCLPNAPTYIGIYMDDVTDQIKEQYDYPHEAGVMITDVVEDGPAAEAGLREHDIIYRFDDAKVENSLHVCSLVQAKKPGEKVTLVIYREGKKKTVDVTLGRRELPVALSKDAFKATEEAFRKAREAGTSSLRIFGEATLMRGRLGMVIRDLNKDLAPYFNVKEDEGVLVLEVAEDSPAEKAGVKAGDVITAVDGTPVHDTETLGDKVSNADEGDTLAVEIIRKGAKRTIDVIAEEGGADYYFGAAPFEWNLKGIEKQPIPPRLTRPEPGSADQEKLKDDIRALKERLKELEERLGKVEKNE